MKFLIIFMTDQLKYMRWSDVTVICGHKTMSMLWATRRTVWS